MTHRFARPALIALSGVLGSSLHAFKPEDGVWWNPAEPGRGYAIEIQDNVLFFAGYLYDGNGNSQWYTAAGTIDYSRSNPLCGDRVCFIGQLDAFVGGQCITCPPRSPQARPGAGGSLRILFDNEIQARLSWGPNLSITIPIQRFDFALTRTQGDVRTEVMLGEWTMMLDYAGVPNIGYPFYGDVLVLDRVDRAPNPDQARGCRAPDSQIGRCTSSALASNDVAAFYDAGGTPARHYFVVRNDPGTFAYYVVTLNLNEFSGIAKICPSNLSNAFTQCINNSAYRSLPVRGYRSASRTRVVTGTGPAGLDAKTASHAGPLPMPGPGQGLSDDEVRERLGIDLAQAPADTLNAITAALQQHR